MLIFQGVKLVGGWTNPIWKICSPIFGVKLKKTWVTHHLEKEGVVFQVYNFFRGHSFVFRVNERWYHLRLDESLAYIPKLNTYSLKNHGCTVDGQNPVPLGCPKLETLKLWCIQTVWNRASFGGAGAFFHQKSVFAVHPVQELQKSDPAGPLPRKYLLAIWGLVLERQDY